MMREARFRMLWGVVRDFLVLILLVLVIAMWGRMRDQRRVLGRHAQQIQGLLKAKP